MTVHQATMQQKYITFFTSPKAFSGHTALIQNNALKSWRQLSGIEAFLLGDDSGVAEAAAEQDFVHLPAIKCSEYGTPLLDDIFKQAQEHATTPLVCFINADIILPRNFVDIVMGVAAQLPEFLGTGRRWDIPVVESLDFTKDAYAFLEAIRSEQGRLYDPTGLDFFIFPKGTITEMPPFCIGRPVWDNWLLWHMKQRKISVVDMTAMLSVYHQNHSYGHVPGGDGRGWAGSPEADYNHALVAHLEHFRPDLQTIFHADLRCTKNGLRGPDYFRRELWNYECDYRPRLHEFIRKRIRWISKTTRETVDVNTAATTGKVCPMYDSPFVSIIIPTYKRAALLPLTLDSMLAQDYPADRFEIIVGDNNSPDDTQAVLKHYADRDPRIRPFFEPRQGVHYVRNHAAHFAKGDILYYTDDDMLAEPSMLRELVKAFENSDVAVATGKVLPHWEVSPPDWVLRLMNNALLSLCNYGDEVIIRKTDLAYSCHEAIRKDVFWQSGGFNPENTAGIWLGDGETGLGIKVQKLGLCFAYMPDAITRHIIPAYRLTQRYLNNRLANQGNCDSYTEYRRDRPSPRQMILRIFRHIVHLRCGMLGSLLRIPWRLLARRSSDGARMALGYFFYYRNRLLYDYKLLTNAEWRKLVLRDDWLDKEPAEKS